jgi:hypothetical protein
MITYKIELGQGLTEDEKREVFLDILEDLMKEEQVHLTVALKILENHYSVVSGSFRKYLVGSKFDNSSSKNYIVAIIPRSGGGWEEIKSSNFQFICSNTLAIYMRDIMTNTGLSFNDAVEALMEKLQIPITEKNAEEFGKIIRSTFKSDWIWKAKGTKKDSTFWEKAFGKYKKQIEWYSRHGCDVRKILPEIAIQQLNLNLGGSSYEEKSQIV